VKRVINQSKVIACN